MKSKNVGFFVVCSFLIVFAKNGSFLSRSVIERDNCLFRYFDEGVNWSSWTLLKKIEKQQ